ncbi:MAG: ribose-phosphate pyrophosphokinase [Chloroflexi bacterium]|nr:ribose-phosphate pyrophosphokinase [Chloroflexota bacterium]
MEREEQVWLQNNLRVFGGASHPALAQDIADYLHVPLCEHTTSRFSNDNMYVQLLESVRGKDVVIIQSFSPPNVSDNIIELLMMMDAAASASARSIHAVIPYYSYARSDKKDEPRISIAGRLMADLITTAGATHVMTMTLHSPQVHGFFSVPTDHLTARPIFVQHFRKRDLSRTVVVSPDIGHAKRATSLARELGVGVAAGDKTRVSDTEVVLNTIIGDIKGKDVIVFDDEIATGGSIIALVKSLREGGVRRITLSCTHGVFSGNAIKLLAELDDIEEIVTTNTVPIPEHKILPNMTVLSVGAIFGQAIHCNLMGRSVGQLFAYWHDR